MLPPSLKTVPVPKSTLDTPTPQFITTAAPLVSPQKPLTIKSRLFHYSEIKYNRKVYLYSLGLVFHYVSFIIVIHIRASFPIRSLSGHISKICFLPFIL